MAISEQTLIELFDAYMAAYAEEEELHEMHGLQKIYEALHEVAGARFTEWAARQPGPDDVTMADWIDALDGGERRGR